MAKYLNKESQWKQLIDYIYGPYEKQPVGWDTEFTNVDFDSGDNCVNRSELDVWSLALYTNILHPRGYETAVGYVLPSHAARYFKSFLEDESIIKPAHNSTVDCHTLYNNGIDVRGVVDTLHMARFAFPGRFVYGIDALSREFLDESKFTTFHELCSTPAYVEKEIKVKRCECGEEGCKKRKGHQKYETTEIVMVEKGTQLIPISDILPGQPRWKQKVEYAGQDAVLALELFNFINRKLRKLKYDNPFRFDSKV